MVADLVALEGPESDEWWMTIVCDHESNATSPSSTGWPICTGPDVMIRYPSDPEEPVGPSEPLSSYPCPECGIGRLEIRWAV